MHIRRLNQVRVLASQKFGFQCPESSICLVVPTVLWAKLVGSDVAKTDVSDLQQQLSELQDGLKNAS